MEDDKIVEGLRVENLENMKLNGNNNDSSVL